MLWWPRAAQLLLQRRGDIWWRYEAAAAVAEQKVNGSGWFRMGWRRRRRKGKRGAVNQAPSKKRTRCWYGCRDKRKWYQGRGPEIQTASVKADF